MYIYRVNKMKHMCVDDNDDDDNYNEKQIERWSDRFPCETSEKAGARYGKT